LFSTDNPAREERFQNMKRKSGSFFAFHGSAADNWHGILHLGIM
ncbi:unnamed protein product, partial [Ectocarpus sp. 8 AP-2014]